MMERGDLSVGARGEVVLQQKRPGTCRDVRSTFDMCEDYGSEAIKPVLPHSTSCNPGCRSGQDRSGKSCSGLSPLLEERYGESESQSEDSGRREHGTTHANTGQER